MEPECTLQCRWCAVCPSVLLLQTVEVRLTSSSPGMVWLFTGGSCVFLLSAGTWKFSSATEKNEIKVKQTSRCMTQILTYFRHFRLPIFAWFIITWGERYCASGRTQKRVSTQLNIIIILHFIYDQPLSSLVFSFDIFYCDTLNQCKSLWLLFLSNSL